MMTMKMMTMVMELWMLMLAVFDMSYQAFEKLKNWKLLGLVEVLGVVVVE